MQVERSLLLPVACACRLFLTYKSEIRADEAAPETKSPTNHCKHYAHFQTGRLNIYGANLYSRDVTHWYPQNRSNKPSNETSSQAISNYWLSDSRISEPMIGDSHHMFIPILPVVAHSTTAIIGNTIATIQTRSTISIIPISCESTYKIYACLDIKSHIPYVRRICLNYQSEHYGCHNKAY